MSAFRPLGDFERSPLPQAESVKSEETKQAALLSGGQKIGRTAPSDPKKISAKIEDVKREIKAIHKENEAINKRIYQSTLPENALNINDIQSQLTKMVEKLKGENGLSKQYEDLQAAIPTIQDPEKQNDLRKEIQNLQMAITILSRQVIKLQKLIQEPAFQQIVQLRQTTLEKCIEHAVEKGDAHHKAESLRGQIDSFQATALKLKQQFPQERENAKILNELLNDTCRFMEGALDACEREVQSQNSPSRLQRFFGITNKQWDENKRAGTDEIYRARMTIQGITTQAPSGGPETRQVGQVPSLQQTQSAQDYFRHIEKENRVPREAEFHSSQFASRLFHAKLSALTDKISVVGAKLLQVQSEMEKSLQNIVEGHTTNENLQKEIKSYEDEIANLKNTLESFKTELAKRSTSKTKAEAVGFVARWEAKISQAQDQLKILKAFNKEQYNTLTTAETKIAGFLQQATNAKETGRALYQASQSMRQSWQEYTQNKDPIELKGLQNFVTNRWGTLYNTLFTQAGQRLTLTRDEVSLRDDLLKGEKTIGGLKEKQKEEVRNLLEKAMTQQLFFNEGDEGDTEEINRLLLLAEKAGISIDSNLKAEYKQKIGFDAKQSLIENKQKFEECLYKFQQTKASHTLQKAALAFEAYQHLQLMHKSDSTATLTYKADTAFTPLIAFMQSAEEMTLADRILKGEKELKDNWATIQPLLAKLICAQLITPNLPPNPIVDRFIALADREGVSFHQELSALLAKYRETRFNTLQGIAAIANEIGFTLAKVFDEKENPAKIFRDAQNRFQAMSKGNIAGAAPLLDQAKSSFDVCRKNPEFMKLTSPEIKEKERLTNGQYTDLALAASVISKELTRATQGAYSTTLQGRAALNELHKIFTKLSEAGTLTPLLEAIEQETPGLFQEFATSYIRQTFVTDQFTASQKKLETLLGELKQAPTQKEAQELANNLRDKVETALFGCKAKMPWGQQFITEEALGLPRREDIIQAAGSKQVTLRPTQSLTQLVENVEKQIDLLKTGLFSSKKESEAASSFFNAIENYQNLRELLSTNPQLALHQKRLNAMQSALSEISNHKDFMKLTGDQLKLQQQLHDRTKTSKELVPDGQIKDSRTANTIATLLSKVMVSMMWGSAEAKATAKSEFSTLMNTINDHDALHQAVFSPENKGFIAIFNEYIDSHSDVKIALQQAREAVDAICQSNELTEIAEFANKFTQSFAVTVVTPGQVWGLVQLKAIQSELTSRINKRKEVVVAQLKDKIQREKQQEIANLKLLASEIQRTLGTVQDTPQPTDETSGIVHAILIENLNNEIAKFTEEFNTNFTASERKAIRPEDVGLNTEQAMEAVTLIRDSQWCTQRFQEAQKILQEFVNSPSWDKPEEMKKALEKINKLRPSAVSTEYWEKVFQLETSDSTKRIDSILKEGKGVEQLKRYMIQISGDSLFSGGASGEPTATDMPNLFTGLKKVSPAPEGLQKLQQLWDEFGIRPKNKPVAVLQEESKKSIMNSVDSAHAVVRVAAQSNTRAQTLGLTSLVGLYEELQKLATDFESKLIATLPSPEREEFVRIQAEIDSGTRDTQQVKRELEPRRIAIFSKVDLATALKNISEAAKGQYIQTQAQIFLALQQPVPDEQRKLFSQMQIDFNTQISGGLPSQIDDLLKNTPRSDPMRQTLLDARAALKATMKRVGQ